jgi:hypothetical protein
MRGQWPTIAELNKILNREGRDLLPEDIAEASALWEFSLDDDWDIDWDEVNKISWRPPRRKSRLKPPSPRAE